MENREKKIKTNIVGYAKDDKVYECIAVVDEAKLNAFFDTVKDYDFTSGCVTTSRDKKMKTGNELSTLGVEIVDNRASYKNNTLKTSSDVYQTLIALSEQGIINFKPLSELLNSDSYMNNPATVEVLREFVKLYEYEVRSSYKTEVFGSVYRCVMKLGNAQEQKDFNALSQSISDNTLFFNRIGVDVLKSKENEKPKTLIKLDKYL